MGSRVYLYLSLWSLLLVACDRAGWRHEALLDRAEHLLVRQPDSARALLADVDHPERLAEGEWARWALLSTWADDEASIRPTSDSTINRVVDYYARRGNRHQRAQAYYCQGRVLTGLGQLKQATTAYLRAAGYALRGDRYLPAGFRRGPLGQGQPQHGSRLRVSWQGLPVGRGLAVEQGLL